LDMDFINPSPSKDGGAALVNKIRKSPTVKGRWGSVSHQNMLETNLSPSKDGGVSSSAMSKM
jgi:hypothetical protein